MAFLTVSSGWLRGQLTLSEKVMILALHNVDTIIGFRGEGRRGYACSWGAYTILVGSLILAPFQKQTNNELGDTREIVQSVGVSGSF